MRIIKNAIVKLISFFIFDSNKRQEFLSKHKKKSKSAKLREDVAWIKSEIQKQNDKLYSKASCENFVKLSEEINEYLEPLHRQIFLKGERGIKLTENQVRFINQVNKKIEKGEYRFTPNKCLCGSDSDELIALRDRYGFHIKTVICRHCGLVRANPYYDNETLAKFYSCEYDPIYRGGLTKDLEDYFSSRVYGARSIVNAIKNNRIAPEEKIVYEIGCAAGCILKAFQNIGCKVAGTDYNKELVEFGKTKGLDLRIGGAECFKGSEPADIFILNHVLEHVTNPIEFLNDIKKILKDDGILFIGIPTLETILADYKNNIFHYLQNAHIFYFSKNTIIYTLECAGFSCRQISRSQFIAQKSSKTRKMSDVCADEYDYAIALLNEAEENYIKALCG